MALKGEFRGILCLGVRGHLGSGIFKFVMVK